jgi:hypothetical protein
MPAKAIDLAPEALDGTVGLSSAKKSNPSFEQDMALAIKTADEVKLMVGLAEL